VNPSKVIKRTVSIPRKLSEYADQLQEVGAFSTFSSYIEDLIRRDWEKKKDLLPPTEYPPMADDRSLMEDKAKRKSAA
jgi:Arc/MetJ-type ribon-helix-helix transcriptional regulator